MSLSTFEKYSARWFKGGSNSHPLSSMMIHAIEHGHTFFCARDYWYNNSMDDINISKMYGSYSNPYMFAGIYLSITEPKAFYEIIPAKTRTKLFSDIEWKLDQCSINDMIDKVVDLVNYTMERVIGLSLLARDKFIFLSASDAASNKGSLHMLCNSIYFTDIESQGAFWDAVFARMIELDRVNPGEYFFVDETEKNFLKKTPIDGSVYNQNRQIRIINSCKIKDGGQGGGVYVRPLIPVNAIENPQLVDTLITAINENSLCISDKVPPATKLRAKRNPYSIEKARRAMEILGITKEQLIDGLIKNNIVPVRNLTTTRTCRISGETTHNDAYLEFHNNKLYYKCHSECCRGKSILILCEERDEEELEDEPPFEQWAVEYKQMTKHGYSHKQAIDTLVVEMNSYFKFIKGPTKPYVLERTVINNRGKRLIEWDAKFIPNFTLTYEATKYCVNVKDAGEMSLAKLWLQHGNRAYVREVFEPYSENNNRVDPNCFNAFRGFAINRDCAATCLNTEYKQIQTDFILKGWCKNDRALCDYVLNWMAHAIQRPDFKMHTALVLRSKEGCGKGLVVSCLAKIIGSQYYFHPTSCEEVTGNFNSLLYGKCILFLDEAVWGGSKASAGCIKKLVTEGEITFNHKYGPQKIGKNTFNIIFASNDRHVVQAGDSARRFQMLDVSDYLNEIPREEKRAIIEAFTKGAEAFANTLYERNISNFDHTEIIHTEALKEQKILSMSIEDRFWIDVLENDLLRCGERVSKEDVWRIFCERNSGAHKGSNIAFWKHAKTLGIETGRHIIENIRMYTANIPEYDTLKKTLNKKYNCNLFD